MSQLRYQCFCYSNTFLTELKQHYFWYVQATHKICFIITLFFGLPLWDTLYYVTTTFFKVLKTRILNNNKIRRLLVRSNYLRKNDTIALRVRSSFLSYFLWYVWIRSWNNVTAVFRFRLLLGRKFITYFILFHNFTYLFKWFHFLMTSELRMEIVETCELRMEVKL